MFITERQGDKIIDMLGKILGELEKMNSEIGDIRTDIMTEIDSKLISIGVCLDNIESQG